MSKESITKSLKNSSLVGGAHVITIIIGIIKTKLIAILIGPSGIGLVQLLNSTIQIFYNIFSLGLPFSAVKYISQNFSDKKKLNRTFSVINKWIILFSIIGILIVVYFSKKISSFTFNNDETYWIDFSLLSITILFSNLAGTRSALVRGTRKMSIYAKINIVSSILSTLISIPIYYFLRADGIVLVLILTSIVTFLVTHIYAKTINLDKVKVSIKDTVIEGWEMVELGLFTVFTSFISQLTFYIVRVHIGDNLGLAYVGYYTAATALTIDYMGIIFGAIAVDYFPKLSSINKNDNLINQAIIDQSNIVLLLGTPLILFLFTFSDYIIEILYSKDFIIAENLLLLMLIGIFFRLISFPISYVFLAKGMSRIFVFIEFSFCIILITLLFIFWNFFDGLTAFGLSFTFSYLIYYLINYLLIFRTTKFKYNSETFKTILGFLAVTFIYFLISFIYNGTLAIVFKFLIFILFSFFCYKKLEILTGINFYYFIKNNFKRK